MGQILAEHPNVDKVYSCDDDHYFTTFHKFVIQVAFTGSTEIGKILRQATAGSGKKLSLELGGKNKENLNKKDLEFSPYND
jgi:hypothetical protein